MKQPIEKFSKVKEYSYKLLSSNFCRNVRHHSIFRFKKVKL